MRLRCLAEEVDRAVHHLDALGGLFSGNEDESAHRRQTPGVAAPLLPHMPVTAITSMSASIFGIGFLSSKNLVLMLIILVLNKEFSNEGQKFSAFA